MFNLEKEKNLKKISFSNEIKVQNNKIEKIIQDYKKFPSLSKGIEIIKKNGINLEELQKIVKIIEILENKQKNISSLITNRENSKNKKLISKKNK